MPLVFVLARTQEDVENRRRILEGGRPPTQAEYVRMVVQPRHPRHLGRAAGRGSNLRVAVRPNAYSNTGAANEHTVRHVIVQELLDDFVGGIRVVVGFAAVGSNGLDLVSAFASPCRELLAEIVTCVIRAED